MQANEPSLLALQGDLVELEGRVRALHAALGAARAVLFPGGVGAPPGVMPVPVIKAAPMPVAPPLPPGLLRPAVEVVKPPEEVSPPTGHVSPDEAA
jgi:hypothetical protein